MSQDLEKPIKTNGFSTFFELLALWFKWPQVSILSQIDPKLAPSCFKLEPSWSQVGSKLDQVEVKLGQNPPPKVPGGSPRGPREAKN